MLLQEMNNFDGINNFFMNAQNRDLREAHVKSLNEMEELKRVQESRVDEFSRRRLIEDQDTVNELTARIQELQNQVNCMSRNDRPPDIWDTLYSAIIVLRCSSNIVLICALELSRSSAILS